MVAELLYHGERQSANGRMGDTPFGHDNIVATKGRNLRHELGDISGGLGLDLDEPGASFPIEGWDDCDQFEDQGNTTQMTFSENYPTQLSNIHTSSREDQIQHQPDDGRRLEFSIEQFASREPDRFEPEFGLPFQGSQPLPEENFNSPVSQTSTGFKRKSPTGDLRLHRRSDGRVAHHTILSGQGAASRSRHPGTARLNRRQIAPHLTQTYDQNDRSNMPQISPSAMEDSPTNSKRTMGYSSSPTQGNRRRQGTVKVPTGRSIVPEQLSRYQEPSLNQSSKRKASELGGRQSDAEYDDRSARKRQNLGGGQSRTLSQPQRGTFWSCPFFKADPFRYGNCNRRNTLRTLGQVKQHLLRSPCHVRPEQCPVCGRIFTGKQAHGECDAHITARSCRRKTIGKLEGLDSNQELELRRFTPINKKDPREAWNYMWRICFPKEPEPPDPFVRGGEWEFVKIAICAFAERAVDETERILSSTNPANPQHNPRMRATLISERYLEHGLSYCDEMAAMHHEDFGDGESEDDEAASPRLDVQQQFLSPNPSPLNHRGNLDADTPFNNWNGERDHMINTNSPLV